MTRRTKYLARIALTPVILCIWMLYIFIISAAVLGITGSATAGAQIWADDPTAVNLLDPPYDPLPDDQGGFHQDSVSAVCDGPGFIEVGYHPWDLVPRTVRVFSGDGDVLWESHDSANIYTLISVSQDPRTLVYYTGEPPETHAINYDLCGNGDDMPPPPDTPTPTTTTAPPPVDEPPPTTTTAPPPADTSTTTTARGPCDTVDGVIPDGCSVAVTVTGSRTLAHTGYSPWWLMVAGSGAVLCGFGMVRRWATR